ncbi:MAG: Butyryl-CoA dehydrogenase [Microbacteriaceae bacterium]|nr:Butyryl-CoA dehydrogenase [Microbacteriaceae bacterium]
MPMDLEERDEFRAVCRDFFAKRAPVDRLRRYLVEGSDFDDDLWSALVEQGWALLAVPENLDGGGGGLADLVVVAEEAGRALQGAPLVTTIAGTFVLARYGVLESHPEVLESIVAGATVTYPMGFDPTSLGERTNSAHLVADARPGSYLLVPSDSGLDLVLVDAMTKTSAVETMDLVRSFSDVGFDSSVVVASIDDRQAAIDLFTTAVVMQAAESLGVARAAFDMTLAYSKERKQFDRTIGSFQAIKHRLADMYIELQCATAAVAGAAESIDNGSEVLESIHTAKSVGGRAASWVTSQAQQVHGGIGFTWEHVLHLYIRRAKANELLLGSPAWHERALVEALAGEPVS